TPGAGARYWAHGRAHAVAVRGARRAAARAGRVPRRAVATPGRAAAPAARNPGRLRSLGGFTADARHDRTARADLRLLGLPRGAVPRALPRARRPLAGRSRLCPVEGSRAAAQPARPRPRRVDAARTPLP